MTHRHTLHVEVNDLGDLAAVVAAIEALGHAVWCPAFTEWSRRAMRDSYLRLAHALMPGPHSWNRSVQLAADIHSFETRIWPRYLHVEEPPADFGESRRLLFKARKLGELPGTDRHLHNIATKCSAHCNFGDNPVPSAPETE